MPAAAAAVFEELVGVAGELGWIKGLGARATMLLPFRARLPNPVAGASGAGRESGNARAAPKQGRARASHRHMAPKPTVQHRGLDPVHRREGGLGRLGQQPRRRLEHLDHVTAALADRLDAVEERL